MKRHISLSRRFFGALFAAILPLLSGCGGSTSGTGGVTVRGQVVDTAGTPLANTTIVSLQSGDATSTDEQGQFELETSNGTTLEFEIEQVDSKINARVDGVPEKAVEIVVRLVVDRANNRARGEIVSVTEKDDRDDSSSGASSTPDDDTGSESSGSSSSSSSQSASNDDQDDDDNEESSSNSSSGSEQDDSDSSADDGEDDTDEDDDEDEREVSGQIRSIAGDTVVVNTTAFVVVPNTEFKPKEGRAPSLSSFSVGENVVAKGRMRNGVLTLEKLETDDD
jgi:hypothetical protein